MEVNDQKNYVDVKFTPIGVEKELLPNFYASVNPHITNKIAFNGTNKTTCGIDLSTAYKITPKTLVYAKVENNDALNKNSLKNMCVQVGVNLNITEIIDGIKDKKHSPYKKANETYNTNFLTGLKPIENLE